MRIFTSVFIVLFQLLFILLYIGERLLGVESFKVIHTPIILVVVLSTNVILFINLWIANVREENKRVALTEDILEEQFKALISSVQSDRHDMNNHLAVISGFIQIKQYEKAAEYMQDLIGEIQLNNKAIMLKSPLLAALIYSKYNRFRQSNIQFTFNLKSDLVVQYMSVTDSVRLLTNLLDNAFDEVSNLSNADREVVLAMSETADKFIIEIMNPTRSSWFNPKLLHMQQSTKSTDNSRGYGLSIIQSIVRKYEGQLDVKIDGGRFCVTIIFPKKVLIESAD